MKTLLNRFAVLTIVLLAFAFSSTAQPSSSLAKFEKSVDAGKGAEIERELFSFVVANPQDGAAFALLARVRLAQNRLTEAKALASKALTLKPDLVSAKLTLAEVLIQTNAGADARSILSGISEKEIPDNQTRFSVAEKLGRVGDCPAANVLLAKLPLKMRNTTALSLRADCVLQSGDKKGINALLPAATLAAKTDPKIAVDFAAVLVSGGLHKEAVALLRTTLVSRPANTDALAAIVRSEIILRDFSAAKIHLAQLEKAEPSTERFFYLKALFESEQGNARGAYDFLERALTVNSSNPQTLSMYIGIALRVNQNLKALRASERLLSIEPGNLEFLYLYGVASLQNNSLQKAETSLVRYFEARPNDPRGCLALGLTYAGQAEKLALARNQLEKCLQIDPANFEAAYQIGLSYKTAGDSQNAIKYFEQTIKLAPDYSVALRDLGASYLQVSAESKARPLLEKAVKLNPGDADAHFQLSRLYNIIGERDLAKKHFDIFQGLRNPKKEGM